MPLPALLLGVAASLAGTLLYRRGRRRRLEHEIERALHLFELGDFDTALWGLRNVATAPDSDSSIARFFIALGHHWRGQWAFVDEELRCVESWPQLLKIYPSRVLAVQLRAELAALRGEVAEAARLFAEARRFATRAVAAQSSSLFVTEALLAWHAQDAARFEALVTALVPARLGPQRARLVRVLGAQLRDSPLVETPTPSAHLEVLAAHAPTLRAFLQRHDPAAQSLAACDGRCGTHFGRALARGTGDR